MTIPFMVVLCLKEKRKGVVIKMKNMFCLLLAMLMVFSASVVSFADEGENTSVTFEISEDTEFGAVSTHLRATESVAAEDIVPTAVI